MKLRVEVDGRSYALDLQPSASGSDYSLQRVLVDTENSDSEGTEDARGTASVAEIRPGVFSVFLGHKSFTVYVSDNNGVLDVSTATQHHTLLIADARDSSLTKKKAAAAGPVEIRAQMPGKVIKLLVSAGATVQPGDGVIVVEAMKMQNEMKSPKAGVVSRIRVAEGATVTAGETLMVVE